MSDCADECHGCSSSDGQQRAPCGEECHGQQRLEEDTVLCDMCLESKQKAVRSCLVCLLSLCQRHLLAHQSLPRLKNHLLSEPLRQMEERLCPSHLRTLELYCRSDHCCLCLLCTVLDHKDHPVVTLKGALESAQTETKSLMEEREKKIREVQLWLQLSEQRSLTQTERVERVHEVLMDSVQTSLKNITQQIQEEQRRVHSQAEDWTTELQTELKELQKRSTQLDLLHSSDHLTVQQKLPHLETSGLKDWTHISVHEPTFASVDRAMARLSSTIREQMKQRNRRALEELKKWAVDVTLDPDTAHPWLLLSEDLKQVHDGGVETDVPDSPDRFTLRSVLGSPAFSSGRFYFEVQVRGKRKWELGVAKESVDRRSMDPLKPENGFWSLIFRDGRVSAACDVTDERLSLSSSPEVVGVFGDYEQGLVSFYDVDSGALIFSFTDCTFREKLCPYFSPLGSDNGNSTPLIILPITQLQERH